MISTSTPEPSVVTSISGTAMTTTATLVAQFSNTLPVLQTLSLIVAIISGLLTIAYTARRLFNSKNE